jgi:aryl-alcohol dehydrogenase-like predicted oxidoreductase
MRGFSSGQIQSPNPFVPSDFRLSMPRFSSENISTNLQWFPQLQAFAQQAGCTTNQLALAWVLAQAPHIVVIPGTRSVQHLQENVQADSVQLPPELLAQINAFFTPSRIAGERYNAVNQFEVDTEQFP